MTRRRRRPSHISPRVSYRSFRLARSGGIILPQKGEWQLFYHSPHGIPILLLLLLVNFSYIDVLAAPPPAERTAYHDIFVTRNEPSAREQDYRQQLGALLKDYLGNRSGFLRLRQEGSDTREARETWLGDIIRTREQLLAMTVPGPMKETHLGAVYVIDRDAAAVRALLAQTPAPDAEQLMQLAREHMELFLRAYSWVTAY